MSRRRLAALAVATATLTLVSPSMTGATDAAAPVRSSLEAVPCAQRMHEAVVQDNVSYQRAPANCAMEPARSVSGPFQFRGTA